MECLLFSVDHVVNVNYVMNANYVVNLVAVRRAAECRGDQDNRRIHHGHAPMPPSTHKKCDDPGLRDSGDCARPALNSASAACPPHPPLECG
ncbi:hypothetical protein [Streptomyces adustus]|uniref:hypothetical protein n=1 Tax=Streptomyces adustus TaxID=1609272 RepID=UPI00371900B1